MKIQLRGPTQRAPETTLPRGRNLSGPVKTPPSDNPAPDKFVPDSPSIAAPTANKRTIIVIDQRVLIRDCLVRCLNAANENHRAVAFSSVSEWLDAAPKYPSANVVVLCLPSDWHSDWQIERDLALLARKGKGVPAVVLTDSDGPDHVIAALNSGARAYVPTSLSLDIAIEAMRLVEAGGTFVPASSLVARSASGEPVSRQQRRLAELFTKRQAAVVEALQHGKANKQIAYE